MKREEMTVGTMVVLNQDIERFPDFMVSAGAVGVVDENEDGIVSVKMNEPIPGCEEWDNCVLFTEEDEDEWDNPPFDLMEV